MIFLILSVFFKIEIDIGESWITRNQQRIMKRENFIFGFSDLIIVSLKIFFSFIFPLYCYHSVCFGTFRL